MRYCFTPLDDLRNVRGRCSFHRREGFWALLPFMTQENVSTYKFRDKLSDKRTRKDNFPDQLPQTCREEEGEIQARCRHAGLVRKISGLRAKRIWGTLNSRFLRLANIIDNDPTTRHDKPLTIQYQFSIKPPMQRNLGLILTILCKSQTQMCKQNLAKSKPRYSVHLFLQPV